MAKTLKEFGAKVGAAAVTASMPGLIAGQALVNNAASIGGTIGQMAAAHPYGTGAAGAVATGLAGVIGAVAHQRGQAKGRRQHLNSGINESRR